MKYLGEIFAINMLYRVLLGSLLCPNILITQEQSLKCQEDNLLIFLFILFFLYSLSFIFSSPSLLSLFLLAGKSPSWYQVKRSSVSFYLGLTTALECADISSWWSAVARKCTVQLGLPCSEFQYFFIFFADIKCRFFNLQHENPQKKKKKISFFPICIEYSSVYNIYDLQNYHCLHSLLTVFILKDKKIDKTV